MVPLNYLAFITACLLTFYCAIFVKAQAEPFLDECSNLKQSEENSYVNFTQDIDDFSAYSGWSSCDDNTVFSMTTNKSWANYHISNASKLYVELYSDGGTFATTTDTGALQIGLTKMNQFSNRFRCKYQRAQDKVYLRQGGQVYSLKCDLYAVNFTQDSGDFEDDDPYYGVNAEISQDGLTYCSVQLNLEQVEWQNYENYGNFFREFYSSSLPDGTNYVRLTLYGYNRLPGGWGDLPNYPMLSRVVITKSEPAEPSEPSKEDPSSSSEDSSAPESVISGKADSYDDDDSAETKRLICSKNAKTDHSSYDETLAEKKLTENPIQENIECTSAKAGASPDASSKKLRSSEASVPLKEQGILQEPGERLRSLFQDKTEPGKTQNSFLMPGLLLLQVAAAVFFLKPR